MKKFLLTLLCFSNLAFGQADWLSPDGMTKVMEGVDDGTFHVSLGHTFPYYGGVFTDAWMSSNGVILLYDPTTQFGNPDTYNSMCCNGVDLTAGNTWGNFSFMLAPLWTDLRDANLTPDDGYYYETGQGGSSFLWYNVTEFGTSNTNTFQANLWPDGSFDFLYDEVDVVQHQTFIGFSGDTSLGDATKLYYGNNISDANLGGMNWWSQQFSGQGYAWYGQDGGYESSLDCSNALNDSRCPGYEEAYFNQQCSIDALYSLQCTGYEAAYFAQQCDYDPFYDTQCPGYDQALLLQDAAGTDFVYGDDISDFYETEITETFVTYNEEIDYGYEEEEYGGYTETYQSEEPAGFEEYEEETFNDTGPLYSEELGEVYTEPVAETEETISDESTLLEEGGMGADTISEDIALEEEYVEESEEITHIEEDMSNIEEDLLISEEAVATEGPKINAVSIALTTAENAEMAAVSLATEYTSQSVVNTQVATSNEATAIQQDIIQEVVAQDIQVAESVISFSIEQESTDIEKDITQSEEQQEFSFSSVDAIFENVTLDMIVDPTITVAEVSVAVESPIEQAAQQEDEQTVDFQMESSTPQMDTGFAAQQDQSFSTGQSITAVLNNVAPNFSQFDVAPPSQTEQRQTARAEAAANNMSQEDIEASMERMSEDMQDSGGFGDQSLTMFLIGRVNGFDAYNTQLQDVSFYIDRGMPGGRVQNDRSSMLMLIGVDDKHERMVMEQYE